VFSETRFRGSAVRRFSGSGVQGFRGLGVPPPGRLSRSPAGARPAQGRQGVAPPDEGGWGDPVPPSLFPKGPPGPDRTVGNWEAWSVARESGGSGLLGVRPSGADSCLEPRSRRALAGAGRENIGGGPLDPGLLRRPGLRPAAPFGGWIPPISTTAPRRESRIPPNSAPPAAY
jgi:hypothetical protein